MQTFFSLFLCVVLMAQTGRACDEEEQLAAAREQESIEYLARAYGFTPNPWDFYQPSPVPEYANIYEGRTPLSRQPASIIPFRNDKNNVVDESNQVEKRFGLSNIINAGLFNNRFSSSGTTKRPFFGLGNRLPISANPNFVNPLATFDSCNAPSGEAGICSPGSVCSLFGGRPSGSCLFGGVCCINAVTTCGGSVTLNNTYWQSPTTAVSAPSTCALTVKLNTQFIEQKKPICQVRLDFVSFSTAQPDSNGVCSDTFQVGGATNKMPTICGDNTGQHMYVNVPSSAVTPTDLQLMFNFAAGATTRSWNIKIAMLPCGASYLAPSECLQFFTSTTGKVSSFNWKDAAGSARQLANQNYNICFRTEMIDTQRATQMCLSACSITNGGDAFSITGAVTANSAASTAVCANDFLLFPAAKDTLSTNVADRFCGGHLNPDPAAGGNAASTTVCSSIRPFRITYQTDGVEPAGAVSPLTADVGNQGFCLGFTQS